MNKFMIEEGRQISKRNGTTNRNKWYMSIKSGWGTRLPIDTREPPELPGTHLLHLLLRRRNGLPSVSLIFRVRSSCHGDVTEGKGTNLRMYRGRYGIGGGGGRGSSSCMSNIGFKKSTGCDWWRCLCPVFFEGRLLCLWMLVPHFLLYIYMFLDLLSLSNFFLYSVRILYIVII